MRGLASLKIILAPVGISLRPLGRALAWATTHLLLLPLYKAALLIRLRLGHVLMTARGFFFLLFTNRYILHVLLLIIATSTIISQLHARGASASEDGQHSLLYALVATGQDEIVQETIHPELATKNANYLGSSTIQAVPHVDFDYEDVTPADLTIPGSIASIPDQGPNPEIANGPEPVPARTTTEIYTVKSGDTVASIARRYGVNVGTIIWANELGARASIKPGDDLKIPSISGVLHVIKKGDTIERIARRYGVDAADIARANRLGADHLLAIGHELVIPNATPPEPVRHAAPPVVALRAGIPKINLGPKSYDQYQELLETSPDTRTKPADIETGTAPTTKFLWPTVGHGITQYYGWRHTGVDIDCDYTDALYAAANGIVEKAGWNSGGYGLQIIIDHQDGRKTRYAHASKLFVATGESVKRGQTIAMCGTTGRSTGTHLHFEVYTNGQRRNPLAYIK